MKQIETYKGFEQGPIRPPSEANSLLVRVTRNCPWNRCTFCPVYKGSQFSRRPIDHVLADIDAVREAITLLLASGQEGLRDSFRLREMQKTMDESQRRAFHAAYHFIAGDMRSIFLQDGNSLILKPDDLERILHHLSTSFPTVERITSYARAQTIAKIADKDLRRIHKAGLNRIHIGMESGSDEVLKQIHKGVDKKTHILAGQKIKNAGMELSEYYMPGLGGNPLSRVHALESADALNQIAPDFIRLRTLAIAGGTPLQKSVQKGEFAKMGEVETAEELLLFLENLSDISSTLTSDHVLNLFQEVEGSLDTERTKMIAPVRRFLQLAPQEQLLFVIGRRSHCMARLSDLDNPVLRERAAAICAETGATIENMDQIVEEITARFI